MTNLRWLFLLLLAAFLSTGTSMVMFHPKPEHTRTGFLEANIRNPVANSVYEAHITPVTAGNPVPCCPTALNALEFSITNLSREPITIDWSRTVFTTEKGSQCGVAFKGGRLAAKCFQLRPDTVAPGKTLKRTLFPGLHASYHNGEEHNTPFVGEVGVQLVVKADGMEIVEDMIVRVGARP